MRVAERTSMDPAVAVSAGAVVLSLYEYFLRGNKLAGIFVGLWPPTILAFASYFKQTRMSDSLDRAMGRSGIVESIERMVQPRQ
jgi:hypothetical protein